MNKTIQHVVATTLVLAGAAVAAFAVFTWSGLYNFAADDPHTTLVRSTLETLRERSIETRAAKLTVPDLSDPARVVQGAGNYSAMCAGCHLTLAYSAANSATGSIPSRPI
ncbi:MAG: hypothetical protein JWQ03_744 [Variovorax sp.]|nr:hypothetical protein [Variovorax sp.]